MLELHYKRHASKYLRSIVINHAALSG